MKYSGALLTAAIACSLCRVGSADMLVNGAPPSVTDRFYGGGNTSTSFTGYGYDLSGVGNTNGSAGNGYWETMVSPSFFLTADHNRALAGASVTFYSGNSTANAVTETVAGGVQIAGTDLYLGMLSSPILASSGITPYSVVGADANALTGAAMLNVGVPWRVGTNTVYGYDPGQTVGPSTTNSLLYTYTPGPAYPSTEDYLEGGDSGGPSFLMINGKLTLVGIHWFDGTLTNSDGSTTMVSGDSYVGDYIQQIDSAMANFGSNERLTVTAVPEPTSLALAGLGLGMFAASRLGRRRVA